MKAARKAARVVSVTGRLLLLASAVVVALLVALVVMLRQDPRSSGRTAPSGDARPLEARDAPLAPPVSPVDAGAAAPIDVERGKMARDERETVLATLRESGPGAEAWDDQALALLASLKHAGADSEGAACFIGGCSATFTFRGELDYRRGLDELVASEGYRAWTGGKRLTTPELGADGRVVVAFVLYRPD
jgi:hypothetical protein